MRKRIELAKEEALALFINGKTLLSGDKMMKDVYDRCKDKDGFLYITYVEESVLG